jgi:hypothetical protein
LSATNLVAQVLMSDSVYLELALDEFILEVILYLTVMTSFKCFVF